MAARGDRRDPHRSPRDAERRGDPPARRRDRAPPSHRPDRRARRLRRRDRARCCASTCRCPAWAARPRAASATSSRCGCRRATLGMPVPEFSPVFNDQEVARLDGARAAAVGAEAALVGGGDRHQEGRRPRRAVARARRRRRRARRTACSSSSCRATSTTSTRSSGTAQVVFAVAFKYGRPPMEIAHQGGLFITRRLPTSRDEGARAARR